MPVRSSVSAGIELSKALFLSPVWPERSSSAAGVRTADLIGGFQEWGFDVAYASSSRPNSHSELLESQGVPAIHCAPNREEELAGILQAVNPDVCVFDRFYAEEAFSFRVRDLAPGALRVLDMQDVHFLRAGRQRLAAQGAPLPEVLAWRPTSESAECLRELASIQRSDLTLVCSPEELRLLVGHYGIPANKLVLAPFFTPPSPFAPKKEAAAPYESQHQHQQEEQQHQQSGQRPQGQGEEQGCPGFEKRSHFLMIGNFRHPPNVDSAEWACRELWPRIRSQLAGSSGGAPAPELHIYGAHAPANAQQLLHKPKEGVYFKGFAPSLDIMLRYRVSFAPLRFGAGLKGKVVDSWWHGLPVCTTPVGAEGMHGLPARRASSRSSAAGAGRVKVDAAEDGYVGQLDQADSDRYNIVPVAVDADVPGRDAAAEGPVWQLGPQPKSPLVTPAGEPAERGYVWQAGGERFASTTQAGSGSGRGSSSLASTIGSPRRAAVDPAEVGYVWQLGPQQQGGSSGKAQSLTPAESNMDPAEQGYAWQLGPAHGGAHEASPAGSGRARDHSSCAGTSSTRGSFSGSTAAAGSSSNHPPAEWGGLCGAQTAEQLAVDAVRLYTDEQLWAACQARGFQLLEELYDREHNLGAVRDGVLEALANLQLRRTLDFTGQLLWQQQFRATEFMSRWIELKEKGRQQ
ncbi:hypothetical protein N2152v2_009003 [Parachlorella kessleri]